MTDDYTAEEPEGREVPLVWTLPPDNPPILYINQIMSQFQEDGFIVSFGQIMPPLLLGTPEQVAEQASRITFVESRTVVRIGLTRKQMGEMVRLLTMNLEAFDKRQG